MIGAFLMFCPLTALLCGAGEEEITTYQRPPREIADAINQPLPPGISVSPTKHYAGLIGIARTSIDHRTAHVPSQLSAARHRVIGCFL